MLAAVDINNVSLYQYLVYALTRQVASDCTNEARAAYGRADAFSPISQGG